MKPLLNALLGNQQSKIPVWFMRQAGRYLPEYREIRKNYKTLTMFKTPDIAIEVTLQPLKRFNLDGAILYADILLIPDALGVNLDFITGEGPKIAHTVRSFGDFKNLKNIENIEKIISNLSYVGETISQVVSQLPSHVTMLGFAGAPFTVASYMIEGGSGSKNNFAETKKLIAHEPKTFHALMDLLTNITIAYLEMQIQNGVEAIQIFESWSAVLTQKEYNEFCLQYVNRIIAIIQKKVPVIFYLGANPHLFESVIHSNIKPDALSIHHNTSLSEVSIQIQKKHAAQDDCKIALQGNLDPHLLFEDKNTLKAAVELCAQAGTQHPFGYVFNLGHGIDQHTPLDNVGYAVDVLEQISHQRAQLEQR